MKRLVVLSFVLLLVALAGADWDSVDQYSNTQGQDGWNYYSKHYTEPEWILCEFYASFLDYTDVWMGSYPGIGWIQIGRDFQTFSEGDAQWTMRQWTCPADLGLTNIKSFYDSNGVYASHTIDFNDVSEGTTTTVYTSTADETKTLNLSLDLGIGDKLQMRLQNSGSPFPWYPVTWTMHIYDSRIPENCQQAIEYGYRIPGDISGIDPNSDCYVNLYDFAAMAPSWHSEGIIADSIAGFSDTQGDNGWTYYAKNAADTVWTACLYQAEGSGGPRWYFPPASWVDIWADKQRTQDGPAPHTKREWTSSTDYSADGGVNIIADYEFNGDNQVLWIGWYDASEASETILGFIQSLQPDYNDLGTLSFGIPTFSTGDKVFADLRYGGNPYDAGNPYCNVHLKIYSAGTQPGDISGPEGVRDYYTDMWDLAEIALDWLACNDPCDPLCPPPVPAAPAGYLYIDSVDGNDLNNSGWTADEPLKTLSSINGATLSPGQQILLKAGSTFPGGLTVYGSGSAGNPIRIDSYGTGDKPVLGGGIWLQNVEYWEINNLKFDLGSDTGGSWAGIQVTNTDFGEATHLHFTNIDVVDLGAPIWADSGGIVMQNAEDSGALNIDTWFDDVLIENCTITNADRRGILITDWPGHNVGTRSTNVVVRGNTLNNIGGDGILIAGCNGALMEYNTIDYAGVRATVSNSSLGVAGMFPVGCSDTIVQYNDVRHTAVGNPGDWVDGEGYDDDVENDGSIFQYNYSQENAGGFMLFAVSDGTIVRYNISQNDKVATFTAAFGAKNASIYNNVFYVAAGNTVDMLLHYSPASPSGDANNFNFYNNVFYADGTMNHINNLAGTMGTVTFENNAYVGSGAYVNPPASDPNPIFSNPLMVSPGNGSAGYQIQAGSPCIGAGKIISGNGGLDFWGNAVPSASAPDVGAHQR